MKKKVVLLPKQKRILRELGENIKLARLRRKLSADQISTRANIARKTLWSIENGFSTVSIGAYLQVLFILGLDKDVVNIARDDELGRKLQDSKLIMKKRAPKKISRKRSAYLCLYQRIHGVLVKLNKLINKLKHYENRGKTFLLPQV